MSAPIESTRTAFETIAHGVSCAVAIHQNHPQSKQCVVASARDEIFRLGSTIGRMSSAFLTVPYDGSPDQAFGEDIAVLLGEVFIHMCRICEVCGIDLRSSVLKKIELNGRKYPVELCKVSQRVQYETCLIRHFKTRTPPESTVVFSWCTWACLILFIYSNHNSVRANSVFYLCRAKVENTRSTLSILE